MRRLPHIIKNFHMSRRGLTAKPCLTRKRLLATFRVTRELSVGAPACTNTAIGSNTVLNEHYEEDGALVFGAACQLGCEDIVSKRLGSPYRSGRSPHWVKVKNPKAPAVKREAEEDWGR